MMRHRISVVIAVASAVLVPSVAQAHLVSSGMGPIYDGIWHFGLSPEDFLPVIALAFFSGLRGPAQARLALGALPVGWLAGGVLSILMPALPPIALTTLTALLFLVIGGLLASNIELVPNASAMIAAVLGLVRGAGDLTGVAPSVAHALTLIGMAMSATVAFALAASVTLPLTKLWMIVVARVTGSWLAALGLLFAGWILRYGAKVQ